jgi:hypothetical protein
MAPKEVVKDIREVPDHATRLRAAEELMNIRGLYQTRPKCGGYREPTAIPDPRNSTVRRSAH